MRMVNLVGHSPYRPLCRIFCFLIAFFAAFAAFLTSLVFLDI